MALDPSWGGGILLAEEIFAQVAAGGVAIIVSGFLGAIFVGSFADLNQLEKDFQEKNLSENEKRSKLSSIASSIRSDSVPPELQKDMDERSNRVDD